MTENTTEPRSPHAESTLKLADAMYRGALWPGIATVVIGAVVSVILVGVTGLWGALVGGVVAFGSSLVTLWMMRKTAGMDPMAVMAVSLGGYILKVLILFAVMFGLRHVPFLHVKALAFTMLAVIVVWAAAEFLAFRRTKIPTIIPASE
jgi:ATP synthase protein I